MRFGPGSGQRGILAAAESSHELHLPARVMNRATEAIAEIHASVADVNLDDLPGLGLEKKRRNIHTGGWKGKKVTRSAKPWGRRRIPSPILSWRRMDEVNFRPLERPVVMDFSSQSCGGANS